MLQCYKYQQNVLVRTRRIVLGEDAIGEVRLGVHAKAMPHGAFFPHDGDGMASLPAFLKCLMSSGSRRRRGRARFGRGRGGGALELTSTDARPPWGLSVKENT